MQSNDSGATPGLPRMLCDGNGTVTVQAVNGRVTELAARRIRCDYG
jgi:hypothetical protein